MTTLIGKPAPDFIATAVMGDNTINPDFNLTKYLKGKIGILFFYPLNFTFVCPSEILKFNLKLPEFKERGAEVIGISVDSHWSHLAYKNIEVNKGGIGEIEFPLVSDLTKQISTDYGVLANNAVAYRGTFLIDQNGIIRHSVINDLPLGRNIDEAIRMVDALLHHQKYGDVCPANWNQGDTAMKPDPQGVATYLKSQYGKE